MSFILTFFTEKFLFCFDLEKFKYPFSLFPVSECKMAELKVEIPERFIEMIGDELKSSDAKVLLRSAVEEKLKVLLLFKVVNDILKDSKLSNDDFSKLVEEYRDNLAKRYDLS